MAYFGQKPKNSLLIPILSCTLLTLLVLILSIDIASSRIIKHHREHGQNSTTAKTTEKAVTNNTKGNDSSSTSSSTRSKGHHKTLKFCQGPGCKPKKGVRGDDHKPIQLEPKRKETKKPGRLAGLGRGIDGDAAAADGEKKEAGAGNKTEIEPENKTVDKEEIKPENKTVDKDEANSDAGGADHTDNKNGTDGTDNINGKKGGDNGTDTDEAQSGQGDGGGEVPPDSVEEQAPEPNDSEEEALLDMIFNLDGRAAWTTGYVKHADVEASCKLSNPCLASNLVLPLCGSDDESYLNPGVFQCAQKCKKNLKVYQTGPCPNYVMPPEPDPTTTPRPPRSPLKHQTSQSRVTILLRP